MSLLSLFGIWYDLDMDTENLEAKTQNAIDIAVEAMSADGDHHKIWGLDQVVKTLADDQYDDIIKKFEEEAGSTWDHGVQT